MKDLKFYLPTHPGAESQFNNASSRMRTSSEEGEDGYLPALWPFYLESKLAGLFNDEDPYFPTHAGLTATLVNTSTLTFVSEGAGVPGGHKFLTKAAPTANDDMMVSGNRGVLLAGTPNNGGPFVSNGYVFHTQLQVSDVSASGLGFVAGWCPPALTTSPFGAAPANGIYFYCTPGQAALTFATVQNGGTVHTLTNFNLSNQSGGSAGAINIAAATDYRLSIAFGQGPSGNTWGRVFVAPFTAAQMGWMTNMSAAQITDIANMITAANVYLSGFVGFRVASTTQRAGYVQYMSALCDR